MLTIFPLYNCDQRRVDSRTLMLRKRPQLQT